MRSAAGNRGEQGRPASPEAARTPASQDVPAGRERLERPFEPAHADSSSGPLKESGGR
jgi:hypothetical protein